jgi:hypothetical protein
MSRKSDRGRGLGAVSRLGGSSSERASTSVGHVLERVKRSAEGPKERGTGARTFAVCRVSRTVWLCGSLSSRAPGDSAFALLDCVRQRRLRFLVWCSTCRRRGGLVVVEAALAEGFAGRRCCCCYWELHDCLERHARAGVEHTDSERAQVAPLSLSLSTWLGLIQLEYVLGWLTRDFMLACCIHGTRTCIRFSSLLSREPIEGQGVMMTALAAKATR